MTPESTIRLDPGAVKRPHAQLDMRMAGYGLRGTHLSMCPSSLLELCTVPGANRTLPARKRLVRLAARTATGSTSIPSRRACRCQWSTRNRRPCSAGCRRHQTRCSSRCSNLGSRCPTHNRVRTHLRNSRRSGRSTHLPSGKGRDHREHRWTRGNKQDHPGRHGKRHRCRSNRSHGSLAPLRPDSGGSPAALPPRLRRPEGPRERDYGESRHGPSGESVHQIAQNPCLLYSANLSALGTRSEIATPARAARRAVVAPVAGGAARTTAAHARATAITGLRTDSSPSGRTR